MLFRTALILSIIATQQTWALVAQENSYPSDRPRPIPVTRPELKQFIEDVKYRTPRIPLPNVSETDHEILGHQSTDYESRVKSHYLNRQQDRSKLTGRRSRQLDDMALDYGFTVELFWLVSRANNCQYCLGHQESKLLAAGRHEDRIAALDCDWSEFTDAERVAYKFAHLYTNSPHKISSSDMAFLQAFYTDQQILEMCISMSWNNAINRWKEAIGVPQRSDEGGYSRHVATDSDSSTSELIRGTYLTPTSAKFLNQRSQVAPLESASVEGASYFPVDSRPALESGDFVLEQLAIAKNRQAILPLAETSKAEVFSAQYPHIPTNVCRLLANSPGQGQRRGGQLNAALGDERLSEIMKAQIQWIVARHDRCWYVASLALKTMEDLGLSEDQIFSLDGDWSEFTPRERALFELARNLASSPVVLTGEQVQTAVELAGPEEAVRVIELVCQLSGLTRLSKAAQIPSET